MPRTAQQCVSGGSAPYCVQWVQESPALDDVRSMAGQGPALPFLLGQFKLADGRTALLLHNQDDRFSAVPNITIASSFRDLHCCEVSPVDGQELPAAWGAPWGIISAGDAKLYVFNQGGCGAAP